MKTLPSLLFFGKARAWMRAALENGRRLGSDEGGAMTSEYVVLVGTVGLMIVSAVVAVGPLLLASYERSRAILIGPFP